MQEDPGLYLYAGVEGCLVKTTHSVVREDDVTSWSSVLRLLLELTTAALVPSAARTALKISRLMGS